MDRDLARAKASGELIMGVVHMGRASDTLLSAGHRKLARQVDDLTFKVLQLDRQIIESPPQPSVAPPLEDR